MEHCRKIYHEDAAPMTLGEMQSTDYHDIAGFMAGITCAEELVNTARKWGVPWEACEGELEALRRVAGIAEPLLFR